MTEAPSCGRSERARERRRNVCEHFHALVRRQGVVDRERELESLAGGRKRVRRTSRAPWRTRRRVR